MAEFLEELFKLNITTSSELRELVKTNLGASMDGEKKPFKRPKKAAVIEQPPNAYPVGCSTAMSD